MILAFLTNKVPFFKYFAFMTRIRKKYAVCVIPIKEKLFMMLNQQICGFELTKLAILPIFRILRHHDIITILY